MSEEVWLPIPGFEHRGDVSNLGRIRSSRGVIRKTVLSNNGYIRVGLKAVDAKNTNYVTVHRLVALAFCDGQQPGYQVNHIDGDKKNNAASNLEWCSASQNTLHAFRLGLRRVQARPIIPYADREKILAARSKGVTFREIGKWYGVCHSSVVNYVYGRKQKRATDISAA
jgi:hypothetical protein